MPSYDYKCLNCGRVEEQNNKIVDRDKAVCSHCDFGLTRKVTAPPFILKGGNWAFDNYDEESAPCTGTSDNPAYEEIMGAKSERMEAQAAAGGGD